MLSRRWFCISFCALFFLLNQKWRRWFTVVSPTSSSPTSWLFVAYFRTYYTSLIHFSFRRLPECTGSERVKKCYKLHNISIDINIPLPLKSNSLSLGLKTCSNTPHVKSTDSQICPMARAIFWVTKEQNRGKIPEKMQNSTLTWMAVNGPYLEKLSMCKRNKQQLVEMAFLLSGCVIFARWKWMQLSGMEEILATSGDIVGRKETGLRIDLVQFHIARFSVVVFKTAESDSREKVLPSNLWTQDTRRKTDAWNLCVCVPI